MNGFNKKKFIIFFLLAIMTGLFAYYLSPIAKYLKSNEARSVSNGPRIEIGPESYDFKNVVYGETASKEFTISNAGNKELRIMRISTSCGCTKAEMADNVKVIAPNSSAKMIVTMDPSSHKTYFDLGEIKRVVYIKSNDLENPEKEIEIAANILKPKNNVTFEITAKDGKLSPAEIEAKENDFVELKLSSLDNRYELKIGEFGVDRTFGIEDPTSVVFKADKKGNFRLDFGNYQGKLTVN